MSESCKHGIATQVWIENDFAIKCPECFLDYSIKTMRDLAQAEAESERLRGELQDSLVVETIPPASRPRAGVTSPKTHNLFFPHILGLGFTTRRYHLNRFFLYSCLR